MDIRKTAEWLKNIEVLNSEHREVQERLQVLPSMMTQMKELVEKEAEILAYMQNNIESQKGRISKLTADAQKWSEELSASEKKSTEITNQKEYQAIQKEMEALKSKQTQLTTQLEAEQKILAELEAKLQSSTSDCDAHQNVYNTKQSKVAEFLKELQNRQKDLAKRLDNIRNELPDPVMSVVHKLSENNIYPFISEAGQNNVCGVCHMRYPAQIVLNAVKAGVLSQCPHCYRLLVPGDWVLH